MPNFMRPIVYFVVKIVLKPAVVGKVIKARNRAGY